MAKAKAKTTTKTAKTASKTAAKKPEKDELEIPVEELKVIKDLPHTGRRRNKYRSLIDSMKEGECVSFRSERQAASFANAVRVAGHHTGSDKQASEDGVEWHIVWKLAPLKKEDGDQPDEDQDQPDEAPEEELPEDKEEDEEEEEEEDEDDEDAF